MASLPAYGVQLNTKFDGTLTDTLVIKRTGSPLDTTHYIPWNVLDEAKQAEVSGILDTYGATETTTVAAAAGYLTVDIDLTGGSPIAAATAGALTVRLNVVGGSPPIPVGSPVGSGGSPRTPVVDSTLTELANDTTLYTAILNVDGADKFVNIVGSTAQTYGTLVKQINALSIGATADINANGDLVITSDTTGVGSSVTFVSGNLFSSLTLFQNTASTTGTDATAGSPFVGSPLGVALAGTPTGLADNATLYTVVLGVDGSNQLIPVVGSTAQRYGSLVNQINAVLVGATAALTSGGNIVITSDTTGVGSSVTFVSGNLFSSLPLFLSTASTGGVAGLTETTITPQAGWQAINFGGEFANSPLGIGSPEDTSTGLSAATNTAGTLTVDFTATGSPPGIVQSTTPTGLANNATVYQAFISVDGGAVQTVSVVGSAAQTYGALITQIDADLTGATSGISGGDLVITSATTGANSKVEFSSGNLFSSLTLFSSLSSTAGGAVVRYTAQVTIDGTLYDISINGSDAQTFGELITQLQVDLGSPIGATIAVDANGNLRITSATTPTDQDQTSTIKIKDNGLFRSLNGFVNIGREQPGVFDFEDLLKNYKTDRGTFLGEGLPQLTVGFTPESTSAFKAKYVSDVTYFDGANWVHQKTGTSA